MGCGKARQGWTRSLALTLRCIISVKENMAVPSGAGRNADYVLIPTAMATASQRPVRIHDRLTIAAVWRCDAVPPRR